MNWVRDKSILSCSHAETIHVQSTPVLFSHALKVSDINCWFFDSKWLLLPNLQLIILLDLLLILLIKISKRVIAWTNTFQWRNFLLRKKKKCTSLLHVLHFFTIFQGSMPWNPAGKGGPWHLTLCRQINLRALGAKAY